MLVGDQPDGAVEDEATDPAEDDASPGGAVRPLKQVRTRQSFSLQQVTILEQVFEADIMPKQVRWYRAAHTCRPSHALPARRPLLAHFSAQFSGPPTHTSTLRHGR